MYFNLHAFSVYKTFLLGLLGNALFFCSCLSFCLLEFCVLEESAIDWGEVSRRRTHRHSQTLGCRIVQSFLVLHSFLFALLCLEVFKVAQKGSLFSAILFSHKSKFY